MMRIIAFFGAATLLAATAASAYGTDGIEIEDTDGDGMYSMEELIVALPDLTDEIFGEIDTDGDNLASGDEIDAAIEAGLIEA